MEKHKPVRQIDEAARRIAAERYGLDESLHVPIAAVSEDAVAAYVGEIVGRPCGNGSGKALLVHAYELPPLDPAFPIWAVPGSEILRRRLQLWVHVAYTRYRRAYRLAFPDEAIEGLVISHAMNRRVAVLRGFELVRVTVTSRSANSSSAFSEGWGVALHSDPVQREANRRRGVSVAYADLTELMLMLDMKLGGGVMEAVNEGGKLVKRP